jgi:hypothetical protein
MKKIVLDIEKIKCNILTINTLRKGFNGLRRLFFGKF